MTITYKLFQWNTKTFGVFNSVLSRGAFGLINNVVLSYSQQHKEIVSVFSKSPFSHRILQDNKNISQVMIKSYPSLGQHRGQQRGAKVATVVIDIPLIFLCPTLTR